MGQVALALKAYHREHGRYPDSLDPLENAGWPLPADPFTGQPLQYRKQGSGFLLWSLGPNLIDDGATPYATTMSRVDGPYDIVLSCSR
jgi:hypothetical protein